MWIMLALVTNSDGNVIFRTGDIISEALSNWWIQSNEDCWIEIALLQLPVSEGTEYPVHIGQRSCLPGSQTYLKKAIFGYWLGAHRPSS